MTRKSGKKRLRLAALLTAWVLCLCAFPGCAESGDSGADNDALLNVLSEIKDENHGADETMPYQMTMEDIQELNGDSPVIGLFNNRGYLSLLMGRFYEGRVTDPEEGILAVRGLSNLLGFGKGCEFYAIYTSHSNTGYTFYTYQQRYGGMTLRNAALRIAVDPDGYTAGLSCSFVPNAGTEPQDPVIGPDAAMQIVRERHASLNLTFYPSRTVRMALPFINRIFNCWVVYTDNPYTTSSFDMPYLEHFVTTYGEYICNMPANVFADSKDLALDQSSYFDSMSVETYRTTVTLEDGSERALEVPVSYNANDGKYYLMDPSRRIAVARYYDFVYRDYTLNFVTSDTISGWSQNNLLAYANYIIMYDFYADRGTRSVDGFETPILITVGWCDENRRPVDNACFYGVINGWACFGVSDINHLSDCVDMVGHEYTHGVTRQSMQGFQYSNATGAINEAYSDIMGNLAEMSLGYTEDKTWLVAEKAGDPVRCMSKPNDYRQPEFVGDRYYKASVLVPESDLNDNGGVHDNSSLAGAVAYMMDLAGMTYEEQISMWYTAIEMMTPLSDYNDLHGILLLSMRINGLLDRFGSALNRAFELLRLTEDWDETYLSGAKDGCGRVTVRLGGEAASWPVIALFFTPDGFLTDGAYTDPDGVESALLPAGDYIASILWMNDDGTMNTWRYTDSGWSSDDRLQPLVFTIKDGSSVELPFSGLQ